MKKAQLILALTVLVAGCDLPFPEPARVETAQPEIEAPAVETATEIVAAAPRPSSADIVVALGDPSDPGLWVKTALVGADTPGRVVTANGRTLDVTLRPQPQGADGGAQISLAALQALRLPLTALTPVTVSVSP